MRHRGHPNIYLFLFFLVMLLLGLLMWHGAARAQHAEMHHFYQHLTIPGTKTSCCDNRDCRPADARWRAGQWEALHRGVWLRIPDNVVLDVKSPDGRAHLCIYELVDKPLCFIQPFLGG